MMKLFTRQNVTIVVAILLVVFVIYARTGLEMSEGDKTTVRQYLIENGETVSDKPFLVYGQFKKLTSDEDILGEVLVASKEGDTDKLYEILDGL
ncbi:hypothetical protein [Bathycoccus sp. RCC716 virus 1]|uniref:Uncharacterized protein n=1 Tax=Bathycoccus sp. RCC716 virus 1 TaxID=2530038 RepID=A0A7S6SWX3_9PHYC|nr:hypothetical protein [Bathycoccus sp. RCC716 virus 1]